MASDKAQGFAAMVGHVKRGADRTTAVEAVQAQGYTYRWADGWYRHVSAMLAAGATLAGVAFTHEVNVKAGVAQAAMSNGTWAVLALDGTVLAAGTNKREALAAYAVKRGTGEYIARANLDVATGAARRGDLITATVKAGVLTAAERKAGKGYTLTAAQREARALRATAAAEAAAQAAAERTAERKARRK